MVRRVILKAVLMCILIVTMCPRELIHGFSKHSKTTKNVDVIPPEIAFDPIANITVNMTEKKMYFRYIASDMGYVSSEIYDTAVLLFRTPIEGERGDKEYLYNPSKGDPLSGIDYKIPMWLANIDESTSEDDQGLVLTRMKVMGELRRDYIEGNISVRFSGSFDFTYGMVYPDCKYYMVIIVGDYYGNVRWQIYDVTRYIHIITNVSWQENIKTFSMPMIKTRNIHGKFELGGWVSHYFILGDKSHIPWIRLYKRMQRCFILLVRPGGHEVEVNILGSFDDNVVFGGFFILRCYGLWRYESIEIIVDGIILWRILFLYTMGIYTICTVFLVLPLIALLVWYFMRRD